MAATGISESNEVGRIQGSAGKKNTRMHRWRQSVAPGAGTEMVCEQARQHSGQQRSFVDSQSSEKVISLAHVAKP
jgi:hypothetical protein